MAEKIRSIQDVVGQTTAKNLLINMIMNEYIPDFLLLLGDSGSGKSTLAEWLAMSCTCTNGHLDPCLECDVCQDNLQGLNSTGKSMLIKKINIATIAKKSEVKEVIKEIFSLPPIEGKDIFYILEEIQTLGEYQDAFLEELERLPKGVHVVGCGTDQYKLKETLLSRAGMVIPFSKLSTRDCLNLLSRKCEISGVTMTKEDSLFLVRASHNNARTIVNTFETCKDMPNFSKAIRDIFNSVNNQYYIDFLKLCFKDFANFIIGVETLSNDTNLLNFWKGLSNFMRESVYYYYANTETSLNDSEKEQVYHIFKAINSSVKIQKIRKLALKRANDEAEAEILLSDIREILNAEEVKLSYKSVEEANSVNSKKIESATKVVEDKPKKTIRGLSLETLNNKTGSSEVYRTSK